LHYDKADNWDIGTDAAQVFYDTTSVIVAWQYTPVATMTNLKYQKLLTA
jgi:hypothetical protein